MPGPNQHRNGHIPVAVGARNDVILPRRKCHRHRPLKHGAGIIADFLQQLAVIRENSVVGILRAVRIARIEVGIGLIGGINQQRALGRRSRRRLGRSARVKHGPIFPRGATRQ